MNLAMSYALKIIARHGYLHFQGKRRHLGNDPWLSHRYPRDLQLRPKEIFAPLLVQAAVTFFHRPRRLA
jgi:hypothetical protein